MNKETVIDVLNTKSSNGLNIIEISSNVLTGHISKGRSLGIISDIFSKNRLMYYDEYNDDFSEYECCVLIERFFSAFNEFCGEI